MLIAAGAIGFSSIIIFTRLITGLTSPGIAFFRALTSFCFFSALLPWFPVTLQIRRYRSEIIRLVGLGLTVGCTGMLYVYAVRYTTAANAVLLNNTSTVYVALLAPWLLREPRGRYTWPSVGLALAGIICIADPAGLRWASSEFRGIVAGTLSGVSYALTMLLSRRLRGRVSGVTQVWWSTGIAALLALPWAFQAPASVVARNLPYILALGVLAQGLPYMLYFLGLERIPAQVVSIVALLEPVSGILIGMLLYREMPTAVGVVGIFLVLAGIMLVSR
ncbi:MAG TPA: DMT family transporter [Anaerolineae bacterium]|nr:DMT family transporter [Anaerolineae bacterium]HQI84166.1 DMT family transporter [Anaerolineae bacterium]